ncbi:MAG: aminotransferase class III-fold pyridoxal phosphate-dependent enzyme [Bacteroidales bacterium]|nr:aminotransferase class III-fold pyridoxal phosphate-dependent enzyme [Bacteroidales bacterium]
MYSRTISASGIVKFPDKILIKTLGEKIKSTGGLLISNEVTAGFGRTGKWFGFEHYEFSPDIISVGKALGNGYPISGVCVSKAISDEFCKNSFRYAQSHQNDPLGCAIGIAIIEYYISENIIAKANETGLYFSKSLHNLLEAYNSDIKEIRARGMMLSMELYSTEKAEALYSYLLEKRFLIGLKQNTIRFMPPLVITKNQIESLIEHIDFFCKNIKI